MVLLIEDDLAMVSVLSKVLEHGGYSVEVAASASAALECTASADYELILLDLMLPDSDGLVLLGRLRALTSAPIIVCSGRSSQVDRVVAFKVGADDFLAKPFDLEELDARITAVLRRSNGKAPERATNELQVGELVVAPARGTAAIRNRPLQLTPTEYRLLVHLASHVGDVMSRTMLAGALWGYADCGTNHIIDVHIARLRRKMRELSGESMIVTVHGAGYSLTA
jgi:DNA-binding response OmpR family regulator